MSSETTAGDAAGNYVIVRTFTATDDAGNSSSASQTITVETPQRLSSPSSLPTTRECSDEMPMDDATASTTAERSPSRCQRTTAAMRGQLRDRSHSPPPTMLEQLGTQTITSKTPQRRSSPSSLPTTP